MGTYLRTLGLLSPYKLRVAVLGVCIVLASLLSSVGITFISPVLRILFSEEPARTEVVAEPADRQETALTNGGQEVRPQGGLPLPGVLASAKAQFLAWLEGQLFRGDKRDMLMRLCLWLFVLYFLKNLFGFGQGALTAELEHRVIYDVRGRLFAAIQSLPLGFFTKERTGYLMSRTLMDVDMMRGSIVGSTANIVSNVLMVAVALTIVVLVSWKLALATLLVVPPNMLLVGLISKRLRRGSHLAQEEMGSLASVLQETISGARLVKASGTEGVEARRFDQSNRSYYKAFVRLKVLEALSSPVSEILGVATAVVVLGFGGHLVLSGQLRADLLFLFLGVMLWVIAPIKSLIKVNSTLQQSMAAANRVFHVLDSNRESHDEGRRDVTQLNESLRFEEVTFAYRSGEPVLHGIDFTVKAGEVVALVGPSGGGKSTLVDLIPRFYQPDSGRVLLDGVPLGEIHLPTLRAMIGMVSQEVILFNDTIHANIAYGSPGVTTEQVVAAAQVAHAHEFVAQLPQGYDTIVGERGTQLSGGQRQRIAIARAVLRDPPILIFDEATSALDSESERLVQDAMENLMKGRTTLVIAHRLSTVTRVDRIVVIDRGRIVETGTHDELLAQRGAYHRLHELQFQSRPADPGRDPQLAR